MNTNGFLRNMEAWGADQAVPMLYYSYDAEGRLISVDDGATASYVYDAEGRRVRRTVGTFIHDLLYDLDGHVMTEMEYDSHYNDWSRGEIYAGGRHLASYMDSTTYFDHGDWLGTERLRTRVDGSVYETCVSLPYGDAQNCTFPNGAGTDSPLHFTGKPRDAETGLDDFGARYGSSTLDRFLTPDWSDAPVPVLHADPSNPQTLNLYSYWKNNPVNTVDKDGHDACYVNSAQIDCNYIGNLLGSDSAVACPGPCSGFDSSGRYLIFMAGAGGAAAYEPFSDITQGLNEWDGQFYNQSQWGKFLKDRQFVQQWTLALYLVNNYDLGDLGDVNKVFKNLKFSRTQGGNSEFDVSPYLQLKLKGHGFGFPKGCLMCRDGSSPSPHFDHGKMHLDFYRGGDGIPNTLLHGLIDVAIGTLLYGDVPFKR